MDSAGLVDEAVRLLPQIVKRMQASYNGYAEASGLTLGQMKTLSFLYHNGRSPVGEIAEGLGLAMPTASELVDKLAERDLVERETNPENRRQVLVSLTETGTAIGTQIFELRRAQIREAFADLDTSEQQVVVRGLRALCQAVGPLPAGSCFAPDAAVSPRLIPQNGS